MRIRAFFAGIFLLLFFYSLFLIPVVSGKESVYKALNPRGFTPEVTLYPLAPRVSDLNEKVVYLLTQKMEGSEMETVFSMVKEELVKRFPKVKIVFKYKPSAYMSDDPELWDEMVKNAHAFIYGAAQSSSTTHWVVTWSSGLEKKGLPGVVINYDNFINAAKTTSERTGTPVRWATISYPFMNMPVKQRAEAMEKV